MKLTKGQINAIIDHTPADLVGKFPWISETLGGYSRPEWNWGYRAGWTSEGVLVVTCFGEVIGSHI